MKILYYYSKLNIGGAERSTVRMLNALAEHGDDVTLLLRWQGGTLEGDLNPKVKIVHLKKQIPDKKHNAITLKLWEIIRWCQGKIRFAKMKKFKFDIAISGLFGYDPAPLLKNIKANCYAQMLRNDVLKTGKYGKTEKYMKKYGANFSLYLGVSEYTVNTFKIAYPHLSDRAHTLYNFMAEINCDTEYEIPEKMKDAEDKLKILTVGRIADVAKGVFRMADVCKQLSAKFDNFKWYVVGEGPDKQKLKDKIEAEGLSHIMILCDGTNNPLSYYKHADLVAVLSYYEGLCGVVNEAKLMERPLIATRFSAIDEQITDGVNGYIVDNDTDAIIAKMSDLLSNPDLIYKTAINGMNTEILDNNAKIDKIHSLAEKYSRGAI